MNKLLLKVMNPQHNGTIIYINNEVATPKKDKNGHEIYEYETSANSVDVSLYKYLEINSPAYFFWQIFFFIISVFGLFDKRPDKGCIILKYHATITLNGGTEVLLRVNKSKKDVTAVQLEGAPEVVEHENIRMTDKRAKKRLKGLKITKFALFVAFVIGIIFLVTSIMGGL